MNSNNKIVLAILWPFAGLVSALRNWRQPWAMNVFWIVCAFLGALHIFNPIGTTLGEGADAGRYALHLQYMHDNIHSFSEISREFYNGDLNDVFASTLLFLVSRFTSNGHVFFFVLAIIYGYFYSRNIWYILGKIKSEKVKGLWILIALFFFIGPIWFINGVRMFTAMHVFCYGALPYILDGDKKKLYWTIVSVFIHFSFLFVIAVLFLYIVFIRRFVSTKWVLSVLFIFYLITLTVKSLDLGAVNSFLHSYLPANLDARIDGYVNEETLEQRLNSISQQSWHVAFFENIQYWGIQILTILSFITIRKNRTNQTYLIPLFSFALFISGFANIYACVPSGGRYIIIAKMFMIPVFLLLYKQMKIDNSIYRLLNLAMLLIAFSLIFEVRKGLEYYGIGIFGNFFTAFIFDDRVPLIHYLNL